MDIYRAELVELSKAPHNWGKIEKPDAKAVAVNPFCGDTIRMTLRVKNGVIKDAKFDGTGCVISKVSASQLTDYIIGKKISAVKNIDLAEVLKIVKMSVGIGRLKCAALCLQAIQEALKNL